VYNSPIHIFYDKLSVTKHFHHDYTQIDRVCTRQLHLRYYFIAKKMDCKIRNYM